MFYSDTHPATAPGTEWGHRGLGERVRDALDLAIALLTLDDDYDVEWELPEDFVQELQVRSLPSLRRRGTVGTARRRGRRPGAVAAKPQPCLSPVVVARSDRRHESRRRPRLPA